jgi:hypothetical protein
VSSFRKVWRTLRPPRSGQGSQLLAMGQGHGDGHKDDVRSPPSRAARSAPRPDVPRRQTTDSGADRLVAFVEQVGLLSEHDDNPG